MLIILLVLLSISVLLEGAVTTLPLVLICLLCFLIVRRSRFIFFSAFLAGLVLDLMRVRTFGSTSLFFLVFLYLVILYKKKYEINSYPFIAVSSFVGAWLYLLIFNKSNNLLLPIVCSIIALVTYSALQILELRSKS